MLTYEFVRKETLFWSAKNRKQRNNIGTSGPEITIFFKHIDERATKEGSRAILYMP